jgi:chemotaxis protein histidine kinase CheA
MEPQNGATPADASELTDVRYNALESTIREAHAKLDTMLALVERLRNAAEGDGDGTGLSDVHLSGVQAECLVLRCGLLKAENGALRALNARQADLLFTLFSMEEEEEEADVSSQMLDSVLKHTRILEDLIDTYEMTHHHRARNASPQGLEMQLAVAASIAATANANAERMRQLALDGVEATLQEALQNIDEADEACGGNVPNLHEARRLLQAETTPLASGAAEAQRLMHDTIARCHPDVRRAIKKADRYVRDVVVIRARVCCEEPDRECFLRNVFEAYNYQVPEFVRAQLLHAYHKGLSEQDGGFQSNAQKDAQRRGAPRARRKKKWGNDVARKKDDEDHPADTGGAASSSCDAAAEPLSVRPTDEDDPAQDTGGAASSCFFSAAEPW